MLESDSGFGLLLREGYVDSFRIGFGFRKLLQVCRYNVLDSDSGFGSFYMVWRSCVRIGFGFRVSTEGRGYRYLQVRIRISEASVGV